MIIAISGKIGSGKDLIGKIIQYLIARKDDTRGLNILTQEFKGLTENNWSAIYSAQNYKIKKFAGKLKQIVSILTGIPVEDLEKQEVKDRVLGEEWWYYKSETQLFPYDTPYEANKKLSLIKPTVREKMVEIADDIRAKNPNAFVNALFADYISIGGTMDVRRSRVEYPNWIISDMRFPNELQAVKDKGGITIRVNRGLDLTYKSDLNPSSSSLEHLKRGKELHLSETALDNAKFDYIIDNNQGIPELIEKVKEILIKEKIIWQFGY